MEKLFTHKDDGTLWRNALYSIWLSYTTSAIVRIDQAVIQNADKKKRDIETKFTEENFHDNENKDSDYSNECEDSDSNEIITDINDLIIYVMHHN